MESAIKMNQIDTSTNKPILSGIITGQLAGLIMAVVVIAVFMVFLGKSFYYPVQVIGSTLFGESALQGFHLPAFLTGLVLHQAGPSLLWGFIYGLVAKSVAIENRKKALAIGIGLGVISMVGPYLLIPFVMHTLQGVDIWAREVPLFWDWAAHIVFGASFALYPTVREKL